MESLRDNVKGHMDRIRNKVLSECNKASAREDPAEQIF